MERSPSLATPKASTTRPPVLFRSLAILLAATTRPMERSPFLATQKASIIRPPVILRSRATQPAGSTRPTAGCAREQRERQREHGFRRASRRQRYHGQQRYLYRRRWCGREQYLLYRPHLRRYNPKRQRYTSAR